MQRLHLNFNNIPAGPTCSVGKKTKKAMRLRQEPVFFSYSWLL
jgi:hypothetical protein